MIELSARAIRRKRGNRKNRKMDRKALRWNKDLVSKKTPKVQPA